MPVLIKSRRGASIILVISLLGSAVSAEEPESVDADDLSTSAKVTSISEALNKIHVLSLTRSMNSPSFVIPKDLGVDPAEIAKAITTVQTFRDAVAADEATRKGLSGKVTFGGASDASSSKEASKSSIGADITLGTYPAQLRLKIDTSVRYENKSVSEDVATILANFDYYMKPGREAYTFVERFSDSYLDIDQRYEVGLGMKFEWTKRASYETRKFFGDFEPVRYSESFPRPAPAATRTPLENFSVVECAKTNPRQTCDAIAALIKASAPRSTTTPSSWMKQCAEAYTRKGCKEMDALIKASEEAKVAADALEKYAPADPAMKEELEKLIKNVRSIDLTDNFNAKRKSYTRIEAGIAIGALSEYENPAALQRKVQTLEVGDANGNGTPDEVLKTEDRKFGQPTAQRFRLSIRPSIVWHLGEYTEFRVKGYFKPALDSPRRADGKLDYRADVYAALGWKFPTIKKKDSDVTIVLGYELHYDNVPPMASPFTLAANEQFEAGSLALVSAKRHRMVKLGVEIPL